MSSINNFNNLLNVNTKQQQPNTTEIFTLPKRQSTVVERFNDDASWILQSPTGNTKAIDTVNKDTVYTQSIRVTNQNPSSTNATIRKTLATQNQYNTSNYTAFDLKMYIQDVNTIDRIVVGLSTDATFANWGQYTVFASGLKSGWNHVTLPLKRGTFTGSFNGTQQVNVIQMRLQAKANTTADVSFQEFSLVYANETAVHFTFDDCWGEQELAITELNNRFMVASLGLIKSRIGTSGYLTLQRVKELNARGYDIVNHTSTHVANNVNGLPTMPLAQQIVEIIDCTKFLEDNKMTRASRCIYFPYGKYDANTLSVLQDNNFLFGRSLIDRLDPRSPQNLYDAKTINLVPNVTAQNAIDAVTDARDCGVVCTFVNHRFTTNTAITDSMFWYIDRWISLLDFIDAQNIRTITTSQYAKAMTSQNVDSAALTTSASFTTSVANGATINILDFVSLQQFNNTNVSLSGFSLTGGILKFPQNLGFKALNVRVNVRGSISGGSAGTLRQIVYELVRADNFSIAGQLVNIKKDTIDRIGQATMCTFINGRNDPFSSSGIKLNFTNDTGLAINLTGVDILITLF